MLTSNLNHNTIFLFHFVLYQIYVKTDLDLYVFYPRNCNEKISDIYLYIMNIVLTYEKSLGKTPVSMADR